MQTIILKGSKYNKMTTLKLDVMEKVFLGFNKIELIKIY